MALAPQPTQAEASPTATKPKSVPVSNANTGTESPYEPFREELIAEIFAMARYLLGGDKSESFDAATAGVLGALDRGEHPEMEGLLAAHADLKALIAPATPFALLAKDDRATARGVKFLGPNPVVRHLALANIFFLLLFFGISLREEINLATLNLSIYEQSGLPLAIKLIFLVAASGLGASFGALFDVWDDLKRDRFDPRGESIHWMKVGLGIVAGLALTEIFQASTSTPSQSGDSSSVALLALVGGFSAGLLHVALSATVNAVKSIFAPSDKA